MLEAIKARPFDWDFAILDLDLFNDLDEAIDELTVFRRDCRDTPILLLSGSATRDEFSDHRRAIGDATLRKPVFRHRLLEGIEAMKSAKWEETMGLLTDT
jgi:CheY-like chemotaxis protein